MKVFTLFLGLPLLTFLFLHTEWESKSIPVPGFDTTLVSGYSYFTSKGIIINESSNIDLLNAIYPWIGTPHKSRSSHDGIDCSALVKMLYKEVFEKNLMGSSADIFRNSKEISLDELGEGDLIFFKINSQRINHVALFINNHRFVHSSSVTGVSINDLRKNYYVKHFYKAARPVFHE